MNVPWNSLQIASMLKNGLLKPSEIPSDALGQLCEEARLELNKLREVSYRPVELEKPKKSKRGSANSKARLLTKGKEQLATAAPVRLQLEFDLPLLVIPESNIRDGTWKYISRKLAVKETVAEVIDKFWPQGQRWPSPSMILLKRYGPRLLDAHDNLPNAFKSVVDLISDRLFGLKDNDSRLAWAYDQETFNGEYFARVRVLHDPGMTWPPITMPEWTKQLTPSQEAHGHQEP